MPNTLLKWNWALPLLAFLLLVPNFFNVHLVGLPQHNPKDVYDQNLSYQTNSTITLLNFVDKAAKEKGINETTSLPYADVLAEVVRKRFYHGYSHYNLKENWMAAVAGRFIWDHLSAIVIPEGIMHYPMAACSQQSIVMMECFKQLNIPFRKVGLDHHFVVEAQFNGNWYLFDTNLEPDFSAVGGRKSLDYLIRNDQLYNLYKDKFTPEEVDYYLANPVYGNVNEYPAPRARLFHIVTKFLSHFLWLLPLLAWIILALKRKKKPAALTHRELQGNTNICLKEELTGLNS